MTNVRSQCRHRLWISRSKLNWVWSTTIWLRRQSCGYFCFSFSCMWIRRFNGRLSIVELNWDGLDLATPRHRPRSLNSYSASNLHLLLFCILPIPSAVCLAWVVRTFVFVPNATFLLVALPENLFNPHPSFSKKGLVLTNALEVFALLFGTDWGGRVQRQCMASWWVLGGG